MTEMAGARYVRLTGISFKFSDITSSSPAWPSGFVRSSAVGVDRDAKGAVGTVSVVYL
jgi:hypothetical protein